MKHILSVIILMACISTLCARKWVITDIPITYDTDDTEKISIYRNYYFDNFIFKDSVIYKGNFYTLEYDFQAAILHFSLDHNVYKYEYDRLGMYENIIPKEYIGKWYISNDSLFIITSHIPPFSSLSENDSVILKNQTIADFKSTHNISDKHNYKILPWNPDFKYPINIGYPINQSVFLIKKHGTEILGAEGMAKGRGYYIPDYNNIENNIDKIRHPFWHKIYSKWQSGMFKILNKFYQDNTISLIIAQKDSLIYSIANPICYNSISNADIPPARLYNLADETELTDWMYSTDIGDSIELYIQRPQYGMTLEEELKKSQHIKKWIKRYKHVEQLLITNDKPDYFHIKKEIEGELEWKRIQRGEPRSFISKIELLANGYDRALEWFKRQGYQPIYCTKYHDYMNLITITDSIWISSNPVSSNGCYEVYGYFFAKPQ